MIVVVSTGLNAPTKAQCKASVAWQKGVPFEHFYVEAAEQEPHRRTALQNFTAVARACAPADILAWVDGDDWLAHPYALGVVARAYEDPDVWLTYGSFQFSDTGQRGQAAPYTSDRPRLEPWKATHLKTFRAGLFHRLSDEDLAQGDGELCRDLVVMFPLLEMAGREHARFIEDVLYVYHRPSACETSASHAERARERAIASHLRRLPPKAKLAAL